MLFWVYSVNLNSTHIAKQERKKYTPCEYVPQDLSAKYKRRECTRVYSIYTITSLHLSWLISIPLCLLSVFTNVFLSIFICHFSLSIWQSDGVNVWASVHICSDFYIIKIAFWVILQKPTKSRLVRDIKVRGQVIDLVPVSTRMTKHSLNKLSSRKITSCLLKWL